MENSASLVVKQKEPKGYPPGIFDAGVMIVKFTCWCCNLILRNPVQCYCGHRVCKECMSYLLRQKENTPVVCRSCIDEDSVGEESYLKEDSVFPDNAIKREMSNIQVRCLFTGCTWTGAFKEYESHYDNCEFFPVECDVCGEPVARCEMASHVATLHTTSTVQQCKFGCEQQIEVAEMDNHLKENLSSHFGALYARVASIDSPAAVGSSGSQNLNSRVVLIERRVQALEEDVSRKSAAKPQPQDRSNDFVSSSAFVGGAAAASGGASDFITVYEGVITVLNREVEKLTTQVEAADIKNRNERKMLDSVDQKIRTLERTLAVKDAAIADLELKITALENTSYNGTLLWAITDLQRRRQEAISARVTSIYSPPFFTSRNGYKMCARLYLNGDGMGKGTHISLFFVVMRGAYDALLKWPFRQRVTLMILDQSGREQHVVDAFRPDPTSSSFKRPTTEMNIASGCPLLLSLSALDAALDAYAKDNTVFIKIIVNCDDLSN